MLINKYKKVFLLNNFYIKLEFYLSLLICNIYNSDYFNFFSNFKFKFKKNNINIIFFKNSLTKKVFNVLFINNNIVLNNLLLYFFYYDLFIVIKLILYFNIKYFYNKFGIFNNLFLSNTKIEILVTFERNNLYYKIIFFLKKYIYDFIRFLKLYILII